MAYTTIDDGSTHFHTRLYSGNGSTQSITNNANAGNFKPDWLWIKERTSTSQHFLFDSTRGVGKYLHSDSNSSEGNDVHNTSFDTNGFGIGQQNGTNENSQTYVAWQWKAGGSTPTKTYKVVVVSDSGNKYRFRNSGDTATFAQSAVTLDLQEGGTYIFDQSDSSNSGHPLRFSTTSNGTHGGGSEYTTGVTTSGTAGNAGAFTQITVAASAPTLYYYCTQHSAMGGQVNTNSTHGQTNFDGSILSVSQANTDAGFSIVTFTGTSSNVTTGHGLNQAPEIFFVKSRASGSTNWNTYTTLVDGSLDYIFLNTTDASGNASNTAPTSSVIYQNNTDSSVAYCFHSVKGYSKMGKYTGNGNADGTFVYTGFKPAWIMIKRTSDGGNDWIVIDTTRFTSNVITNYIRANTSDAETDQYDIDEDILSNGFKLRGGSGNINASGSPYIYMAFAEHPFVSSKGVPTTAR